MKQARLSAVVCVLLLVVAQTRFTPMTLAAGQTFIVTNTANGGVGSLNQAILNSNTNGASGTDTIALNIPGGGVHTIQPTNANPLPVIISPVLIDGLSQPGASCASWPPTLRIEIDGSIAGPGTSGPTVYSGGVTIRGLVINRFSGDGLFLAGFGDPSVIASHIECNVIGADATGTQDRGNGFDGISIGGSGANLIGGSSVSKRNLISGNGRYGIFLNGERDDLIANNYIGTDATGTKALGNDGAGIFGNDIDDTTIGGASGLDANRIAFNGAGVVLAGSATSDNSIMRNVIVDNSGLGIDLGEDGVDDNDDADADPGPNGHQNYPVLSLAHRTDNSLVVEGILHSAPNGSYRIEFYSVDTCDPTGFGEGGAYSGHAFVFTDANNLAEFSVNLNTPASVGSFITAVATSNADGSSSEFSTCKVVTADTLDQTISFAPLPNRVEGNAPFKVNATASSGLAVTFTASGKCTVNKGVVTLTGDGSCAITAHHAGDEQYNPAPNVTRAFQIKPENADKLDQTISFAPLPDKVAEDAPFEVSATASSELPVTFTASGKCTVKQGLVTLTGVGSCAITAGQGGNTQYNAAPTVTRSFQIAGPGTPNYTVFLPTVIH